MQNFGQGNYGGGLYSASDQDIQILGATWALSVSFSASWKRARGVFGSFLFAPALSASLDKHQLHALGGLLPASVSLQGRMIYKAAMHAQWDTHYTLSADMLSGLRWTQHPDDPPAWTDSPTATTTWTPVGAPTQPWN